MDPTALPTDNLYKFLALGSLAAMVYLIHSGRKLGAELMRQKREAELEAAKHSLAVDNLAEDVIKATTPRAEDYQRFRSIDERQLEVDHKKKLVNELIDRTRTSLNQGLVLTALFGIATIFGFVLWYFMSQRYQDEVTVLSLREQRAKTQLVELELVAAKKKPSTASSAVAPQSR